MGSLVLYLQAGRQSGQHLVRQRGAAECQVEKVFHFSIKATLSKHLIGLSRSNQPIPLALFTGAKLQATH
jgi:hypothetical protein